MEYIEINEAWQKYLEDNQKSAYMQRLSLKEDQRLFMEGYMRGFEMAQKDKTEVGRIEIINHTQTDKEVGRIFTYRGDVELSFQDNNKTLKIFI